MEFLIFPACFIGFRLATKDSLVGYRSSIVCWGHSSKFGLKPNEKMTVKIIVKANGTGEDQGPTGYAMQIQNSDGDEIACGWGRLSTDVNRTTTEAIEKGIRYVREAGYTTGEIEIITDIEWLRAWVEHIDSNAPVSYQPDSEEIKLLKDFAKETRDDSPDETFLVIDGVKVC